MIDIRVRDGLGILFMSRPWVHNTVNLGMMKDIERTLQTWKKDDRVKVIMISGEGDTFCHGADVQEIHQASFEQASIDLQQMTEILYDLSIYPKPTIAAINGQALGGGCEIAAACDFRLAHDKVKLGFVHIEMGISTGWGGLTHLLNILPQSTALEWVLTGDVIDGTTAYQTGFVDKVFPQERFMNHVINWAKRMSRHSGDVLQAYKRTFAQHKETINIKTQLEQEVQSCVALWNTAEHQTAITQYLKRTKKS